MMNENLNFWIRLPRPFQVLAPMEDVTDTVFRRLVAECAPPDVFFTEFTSVDGLCSPGRDGVIHRLQYTEGERPLVAQIWGLVPEHYYESAKLLKSLGFDGIDLNMGCPVPKIIKKGACSALIENPTLARELFLATVEGAGGLPVSIKTRIGFRKVQTEVWSETLLALKPAVLTIHGRTAKQLSHGSANWDEVKKVVQLRDQLRSSTLIVGNGDVMSRAELLARVEQSGVDGVMIGRGIFHNLFVFSDAVPLQERSIAEKLQLLVRHCDLYEETWGAQRDFNVLKRFFKIYVNSFRGASELRVRLNECDSYSAARKVVREYCAAPD